VSIFVVNVALAATVVLLEFKLCEMVRFSARHTVSCSVLVTG